MQNKVKSAAELAWAEDVRRSTELRIARIRFDWQRRNLPGFDGRQARALIKQELRVLKARRNANDTAWR